MPSGFSTIVDRVAEDNRVATATGGDQVAVGGLCLPPGLRLVDRGQNGSALTGG